MLYTSDSLPTSTSSAPAGSHVRSATVANNPGQLRSPTFGAHSTQLVQTTLNTTPMTDNGVPPTDNAVPPGIPPTPPSAPKYVRDLPADDRLGVLLAVHDTMTSTMHDKINSVIDEQDAASAAAVAAAADAAGSSQGHVAMPPSTPNRRPKFAGAELSPGLDPIVGGSGGRPSHAIVFDHEAS